MEELILGDRFVKDGRCLEGLICCESATYIHMLSSYPASPLLLYTNFNIEFQRGIILPIYTPALSYEDTDLVANKLYVTNKERTICDLINRESNEEYIYESVETYLDLYGSQETLVNYANKYNCKDGMLHYINTLPQYLSELI